MADEQSTAGARRARSETMSGVERALDVLMLFAHSKAETLGVTEIAEELQLSKAAVHRILSTLRAKWFLELDESSHRYRLGPETLILGLGYLDRMDLRNISKPRMADLVKVTNETVTLSIRVGWTRVYVDQTLPERDIKMMVQLGKPFPLHAGSSSKALLAFLAPSEQEEFLTEYHLEALTPHTITDPDRLRRELAAIREKGYAVSFGERDAGAGSVAAPVFRHGGGVEAVISVSGPIERFSAEVEQSAAALLTTAREISRRLGFASDH